MERRLRLVSRRDVRFEAAVTRYLAGSQIAPAQQAPGTKRATGITPAMFRRAEPVPMAQRALIAAMGIPESERRGFAAPLINDDETRGIS